MVLVGTAEFEVLQPTYFPANTQALAIWRASICKQKLHSMCCTQPVFLQACRWYLFGVQVCEQKHGLVRSPNTRKNKRPKQPCNQLCIYNTFMIWKWPITTWWHVEAPPELLPPHRSWGSAPGRFGVRALGRKNSPWSEKSSLVCLKPRILYQQKWGLNQWTSVHFRIKLD